MTTSGRSWRDLGDGAAAVGDDVDELDLRLRR